jgi:hypothetical protein
LSHRGLIITQNNFQPVNRYKQTNVVLLEPDLAKVFNGSDVVNQALRECLSEHGEPPKVSKAG